jgi:hypothetical protein
MADARSTPSILIFPENPDETGMLLTWDSAVINVTAGLESS